MLSVRLDPEILEALDRLVRKSGLSRSEIIRKALRTYVQREAGREVEALPVLHLGGEHPSDEDLYVEPEG